MSFVKIFRDARRQKGLSQKEVANILEIHQSNISDWENDISRPDYEKLMMLSIIYDISLEDSLDFENFKKNFLQKKK